jgi:hypothetical protein
LERTTLEAAVRALIARLCVTAIDVFVCAKTHHAKLEMAARVEDREPTQRLVNGRNADTHVDDLVAKV